MILIYCPVCEQEELVSSGSVKSIHNTDRGILGLVDCYEDHALVHNFATGKTLGTVRDLQGIVDTGEPTPSRVAS